MTREIEADNIPPEDPTPAQEAAKPKMPRLLKYRPLLRLKALQGFVGRFTSELPKFFMQIGNLSQHLDQVRPTCAGCGTCLNPGHPAVSFYREPSGILGRGGQRMAKSDGPVVIGCRWCDAELRKAGHARLSREEVKALLSGKTEEPSPESTSDGPESPSTLRVVK